jgi:hypothetical protein
MLPNLPWRTFHTFVTGAFHLRRNCLGSVIRMTKTATPFGPATVVERVTLPQKVGDKRFHSLVELLETDRGDRLVRVAYSTGGAVRRGPVTLRARDLDRLRAALANAPALADVLRGAA